MADKSIFTFDGEAFVIYRKVPRGFARPGGGRTGMPRFRHPTMASALAEAHRLLRKHPESTFVILQEVATVNRQEPTNAA